MSDIGTFWRYRMDWNPRTFGPSREERAAAAERRALPRRGYTYAASDGLTDRQRRRALAVQAQERRRQQREQRRQVRIGDREDDRARRRARRDAGGIDDVIPITPPRAGVGYADAVLLIIVAAFALDLYRGKAKW